MDLTFNDGLQAWKQYLTKDYLQQDLLLFSKKNKTFQHVPPFAIDVDEKATVTEKRHAIAKRVKGHIIRYAEGMVASSGSSLSNQEQLKVFITHPFMKFDSSKSGIISWDIFLQVLEFTFTCRLSREEAKLFKDHLHLRRSDSVAYVKFVSHILSSKDYSRDRRTKHSESLNKIIDLVELFNAEIANGTACGTTLVRPIPQTTNNTDYAGLNDRNSKRIRGHLVAESIQRNISVDKVVNDLFSQGQSKSHLQRTEFFMALGAVLNLNIPEVEQNAVFNTFAQENQDFISKSTLKSLLFSQGSNLRTVTKLPQLKPHLHVLRGSASCGQLTSKSTSRSDKLEPFGTCRSSSTAQVLLDSRERMKIIAHAKKKAESCKG